MNEECFLLWPNIIEKIHNFEKIKLLINVKFDLKYLLINKSSCFNIKPCKILKINNFILKIHH